MKRLTGTSGSTTSERIPERRAVWPRPRPRASAWNPFLTGLAAGIAATLTTIGPHGRGPMQRLWQDVAQMVPAAPQHAEAAAPATVLDTYEALKNQRREADEPILAADRRVFELEKQLVEAKRNADETRGMLNGVLATIEQKAVVDPPTKPKQSYKELARQLNPDVVAWLLSANDHLALYTKTY